jgi:transcriptional regulator with XRE-family HTH domain
MNQFGINLKKLLAIKGISQTQLAQELGIKQSSVSDWINRGINPELEKLIRIAKILEVSLDELVLSKPPYNELEQKLIAVQEELLQYKTKENQQLKNIADVSNTQ